MRIHIYSRNFAPAVGGMERLMELLAREFVRQGHAVTVVTETGGTADLPFPVERAPGAARYAALARDCDVILSAPLSLRRLPAQLLARRPIVVTHPILYLDRGRHFLPGVVKRLAARLVTSVVPSRFMAGHFPRAQVIANPYDAATFRPSASENERSGVLFVGRLVPEKGCDLLLDAFARSTAATGSRLTIVGNGPELPALRRQAEALGLSARVEFRGELIGTELAAEMLAHRVMAVPTLCEEAFGIVALEGLACGCRMVVAESGGLLEAVGPLALTFPRGDAAALAGCIDSAFGSDDVPPSPAEVAAHLERFTPERIASRYLEVLSAR